MRDWTDQPEASGPLSESDLARPGYGDPGMPSIGRIEPPATYPDLPVSGNHLATAAEPEPEPAGYQLVPGTEPAPDLIGEVPAVLRTADPSSEAIERNLAAEQAADAGRAVPEDATVIS